jgi:hypothetical protein
MSFFTELLKVKILLFFAAIVLAIAGVVAHNRIATNRMLDAVARGNHQTMQDMRENAKKMRDYSPK